MHALEKVIVYYNHCEENDIYKSVIGSISKNPDKVKNTNTYELAELCYISPTTISRLSKKVYFYTRGNESAERHFQELLIISGKESAVIGLSQLQMENAKTVDSATTVICLAPVINESGDVGEAIQAAKEAGTSLTTKAGGLLCQRKRKYRLRDCWKAMELP